MKLLTMMLEVDLNKKDGVGARMLTINFMHPQSLYTWLEMRRMVFDVGLRFNIRMQGDLVCFIITVGVQIIFLIATTLGYVDPRPLVQFWHYIGILLQIILMLTFNAPTLQAAS